MILPRVVPVKDIEFVRLETRQTLCHSSNERCERNGPVVAVDSWNEIFRVDNIDLFPEQIYSIYGWKPFTSAGG